jgi:exosome complex exonuclease RRP6
LQAASLLEFEKKSLSFLIQHYCQVYVDKKYQLEDWRIRPLPQEMVNYAREDTHYLIYIYERLKQDLYSRHCLGEVKTTPEKKKGTPKEPKDRNSKSKSSQLTPVNEKGVNQVLQVWNNSRSVSLKQFRIPTLNEMYSKFYTSLNKEEKMLNNQQAYALQEIFSWRDRVARELDESIFFVMSKFVMLNIISQLHNEPEKILKSISLHRSVHQHLPQLHDVIARAKAIAIQSSPMLTKKQTKKSGAASSSAHELSKNKNNFHGESPLADDVSRSENKASKWRDSDIPALIRILHGNYRSKHAIAEEFLLHLEQNRAGESKNGNNFTN